MTVNKRRVRYRLNYQWHVRHDPLGYEAGGFKPGSEFSGSDVMSMLDHGALVDGTILKGRSRMYKVYKSKLFRLEEAGLLPC
jgi:hypothetical protein